MDDSLLILGLAAGLMSLVVAVKFVAALRRVSRDLGPDLKPAAGTRLSVIIPARDEEQDIAAALQSVLDQQDVDLEVIVVNDHSSDRTGTIADSMALSQPRLRVIHNPELSPGWLGKCNAMQRAVAGVTGSMFLFTDADIVHQPRCFVTAMAEMERRELDFLSLFPLMDCVSLGENVILFALIGSLAIFATPGIEDPRLRRTRLPPATFLMIRARCFAGSAASSRSSTKCWTTWRSRSWSSGTAIASRSI